MPSADRTTRRALKILELIDDASVGGGQRHVLLLARGLKERGRDVHVACAAHGYLVDELRKARIEAHAVDLRERPAYSSFSGLVRLLRAQRYDIIHTHGGTAGFWGRIAALRAGVPRKVHTYHGLHSVHRRERGKRVVFRALDRTLVRWTDHVICVSNSDYATAQERKLLSRSKSSVVRNGIDIDEYRDRPPRSAARASLGLRERDFVVGTIGRLESEKGHRYLVEAFSDVLGSVPAARLVIIGDGALRPALEEQARRLGLGQSVLFAGSRNDVSACLEAMDVFVLPSLWEGLPLTILEAFACAVPVVATATGGAAELVRDGVNGLLAPPQDPRALAAAIARLVRDPELRNTLSRSGSADVRAEFTAERMVDATDRIYSSLVP